MQNFSQLQSLWSTMMWIVLAPTSHFFTSEEWVTSSVRSFSLSSSMERLTVTVSSFSRSTMRPNFCSIILLQASSISEMRASNTLRSLFSWMCFLRASLKSPANTSQTRFHNLLGQNLSQTQTQFCTEFILVHWKLISNKQKDPFFTKCNGKLMEDLKTLKTWGEILISHPKWWKYLTL